jgi:serine/threonine protein kinase
MNSLPTDDDLTVIQARGQRPQVGTTAVVTQATGTGATAAGTLDFTAPTKAATATEVFAATAQVAPARATDTTRTDESQNALPAGACLAEFEITGVLGIGGFGIVYTARDHSLQRQVALKEYMPSSLAARGEHSQVLVRSERHRETFELGLRSFVNEARLLAQFDHPSLVKVYRFWEANGTAYMVMPLYQGVTLKKRLQELPAPPDEAWLLGLLAPLTEALAVIHHANCFHRDIAPDNIILLSGSERPLLLDFGAARRVISDVTQALTVILKPGFAPVEQYAEVPEMKQGAWTDIYALAATVHHAITGRTPAAAVGRLMKDSFTPLSSAAAGRYSPGFLLALDNALKVRPEDRTPSVEVFRAELGLPPLETAEPLTAMGARPGSTQRMTHSSPLHKATPNAGAALPSGTTVPGAGGTGRQKGMWMAAAAVFLLCGAGLALWLRPAAPTLPTATANAPSPAAAPVLAAPATPAVATPPPTQGFEIRNEFDRVLAGQTDGFKVQASPEKQLLRIGSDKLAFKVTSARDGYVQVLVLGPTGTLMLLFPNAQASDNRIKAGQTLTLPQAGWPLEASEPAGIEDFLVIVSEQPRDYSELSKDREYIFLKLPTGQRGAEATRTWTRSTPLLLGGLKQCPSADCEAYGAASFSVNITH